MYIIISLVAALVLATVLTGLLYCICWIIAFINENNIIIFNVSVSQEYDIYYIKSLLDSIIFEKYLKIFRMDTTIDGDNKLNITLINL